MLIEGLVKEIRRRRHEHERTTNAQQQQHAEEEGEEQPASSSMSSHAGGCALCSCPMCNAVQASVQIGPSVSLCGNDRLVLPAKHPRCTSRQRCVSALACNHATTGAEGRRKKKGADGEEAERQAAAKEAAAKEQEDIGQQLGCGSVAAVSPEAAEHWGGILFLYKLIFCLDLRLVMDQGCEVGGKPDDLCDQVMPV